MAEANHMVQINDAYHDKGLQIIGINLDQERSSMDAAIQQTGFDWPQYFDGKGWSNDIVRKWRVDSIPRTFLIGPDGDVLWTGHPAQIDAALKDAFANHPPQEIQ
jgi:hypothetical protein